ncbi:MAG: N-acetyl-gamma-glutamyl-phosphate reductase [Planctomycetota bacterium]|nr:N-acetyl-gamma-glutamyl-phosphate reductase [Planctomycetota bacterium]
MIRVGIVGATGYTAFELIKILLRHPRASVTCMTSRESTGRRISEIHPQLEGLVDLAFEPFDPKVMAEKSDFAFCCLPHGASAKSVRELREEGLKVIDFSADYRLSSLATYESWYGVDHPDPGTVGKVPYGLAELFREEIASADLVANPGCFPTSAILGLAPLLKAGMVLPEGIIVDSKTGVSGAGRKPSLPFHFPECNESVMAYKVASHRHQPEIDDLLERTAGVQTSCLFTPHLVPMDRGILSTIYAGKAGDVSEQDLMNQLAVFYEKSPFVRVRSDLPATRFVSGTNFCDLSVRTSGNQIILVSCLDNLIKGASGAAVQNFNLMNGFEETCSLL